VSGPESEHLRAIIRDDSRILVSAAAGAAGGFDLANGALGAALLLDELQRSGLTSGLPSAQRFLILARQRMRSGHLPVGLWHGLAGYHWVRCHVTGKAARVRHESSLLSWVNAAAGIDLISGLAGVGVLGLKLEDAGDGLVDAVVRRLSALARFDGDGVSWPTPAGAGPPRYDLGVAHGQAGVVAFLAAASTRRREAGDLLVPAANWLVARAQPLPSRWAFAHVRGGTTSRLAWCYGDPGAAVAIALAGHAVGSGALCQVARDVARRAARRTGDPTVVDAGLCHGSAGLAHLFARLWQYTGEETCAEASRFWLLRTLENRSRYRTTLPFPSGWERAGRWEFRDDAGLVTGGAGACLALLSATEEREPRWDGLILLSV
jgi:lantibiotic biosynthesis protein